MRARALGVAPSTKCWRQIGLATLACIVGLAAGACSKPHEPPVAEAGHAPVHGAPADPGVTWRCVGDCKDPTWESDVVWIYRHGGVGEPDVWWTPITPAAVSAAVSNQPGMLQAEHSDTEELIGIQVRVDSQWLSLIRYADGRLSFPRPCCFHGHGHPLFSVVWKLAEDLQATVQSGRETYTPGGNIVG